MAKFHIADLDCIYLTYDEPQKELFWVQIKNMVPWAVRVDGVKGSDAAHKAAAAASQTDRFILIDGDNIPDAEFFDQTLDLEGDLENCVFRWRARNIINGLIYGNGGISCWTKEFVQNMRTHENTDGKSETMVEFCFDPRYMPLHNCYSTTYPNYTPFQAWRAGFREGVKMCLDRGKRLGPTEFRTIQKHANIDNLEVWHSVGTDVENGKWAIIGARMGTYMTMLQPDWDYTDVRDFDSLAAVFEKFNAQDSQQQAHELEYITQELKTKLGLAMVDFTPEQSAFWKKFHSRSHKNWDILSR